MNKNLNHWSHYWQSGVVTSLPQDFDVNYEGALKSFWQKQFNKVPQNGKLLDVCTGNGAIALLAADFFSKSKINVKIEALDAAEISIESAILRFPKLNLLSQEIKFLENTPLESCVLNEDSYQLISSQYGVEYTDWKAAAQQLYKLLETGGRFVMVCHGHDTAIMKQMSVDEKSYEKLASIGFFEITQMFLAQKLNVREFKLRLTKAFQDLGKDQEATRSSLIGIVANFCFDLIQTDESKLKSSSEELNEFLSQHTHAFERLKDVVGVSRQINENPDWYQIFEDAGLELEGKGVVLHEGAVNAGYHYSFRKK